MGRWIAVAVMFLVACTEHGKGGGMCVDDGRTFKVGETFPAGDGCNSCTCTASGIACTELACLDGGFFDGPAPPLCAPSGGCPEGPACNGTCCGRGEKCVSGTCTCGSGPACTMGNTCEAAGPAGTNACGTICCGASGPCPL